MEQSDKEFLQKMALRMRKDALDIAYKAGAKASHFGGGVSSIDILAVLYGKVMKFDHDNPEMDERDRFILSKGHGVLAYYAALKETGFITEDEFDNFEGNESILLGHPVKNRKYGIEFTSGSLGMGLSLGIGTALALKKKNLDGKIYVLMGDGECNEGSVWEGFMSVPQFGLKNIIAIIDRNKFQLGGKTSEVMDIGNMAEKLNAFGWDAIDVDGHEVEELYNALTRKSDKPLAIIANTVKGKGFSFAENNNSWHHAVLTKTIYEKALIELEEELNMN